MDRKRKDRAPPPGRMPQSRQPEILTKLDAAARNLFLQRCRQRLLAPGSALFDQGTEHSHSYLIKHGLVRTYYLAANGREITLAYWSDGDLIGGPNFFGGCDNIWSAKAMEQTEVFTISGEDLKEVSRECTDVAISVIEALSFKLRWL